MVEGNSPTADWPKYTLKKVMIPIELAREANKYLFIWDKQGSVGNFMQY